MISEQASGFPGYNSIIGRDKATIGRLYPDGFAGWDLEHGGVFETSLMLALYPHQVSLERAVDHAGQKLKRLGRHDVHGF